MKTFNDRVAVVTGAASGIGRGMAEEFAARGMRVVLADVEEPALKQAASEMSAGGAKVLAVPTDVSRPADLDALAERAYAEFGAVHVLCNNAGVGSGGLAWDGGLDDWHWVLGVNLWGVIHGIRSFVPRMLAGGEEGHIVNTASMAGLVAGPFMARYNVSKFGVVALSETLHHDLAITGSKLKVSVLCPGWVNTRISESSRNRPGGAPPPPVVADAAAGDRVRQMLASGMDPREVGRRVVAAIRDERFYILTHPEMKPAIQNRMERVLSESDPPPPGFL